ncbi:DUF2933 domain-containing protein [Candidatus Gottesmanbacteria bacterium]|nr:DUF2933 domain-containing protein [Candidatus Gottesmanbacteria bacterium]
MKKWLLPALCALPIVGVILWYIVGKNTGNLATFGLILACPLAHIFMMKHDHGNKKGHVDHKDHQGNHV